MTNQIKFDKLYEELNTLNESLELINLFQVLNHTLKEKAVSDNSRKQANTKRIVTKYGEHLEKLVSEVLMGKREQPLVSGILELERAERSLHQLGIMRILFEEKIKRIKLTIDTFSERTKEER
jgi:hypothetical protein